MAWHLVIGFGGLVGFALGLTGAGGSLLAVPLLVYGLSVAPREAFGISLAAVGSMALVGVLLRARSGQVEFGTGVWFAVAGMLGAPIGVVVAGHVPETMLLTLFAGLMLVIAARIWTVVSGSDQASLDCELPLRRPACQRTESGRLRLTSRCAAVLAVVGLVTGFLSGMFGVGGGFVIVPALIMFSGMPIHRAVATSTLVVALVSLSGVTSFFVAGRGLSWEVTAMFVAGGLVGLLLGMAVGRRISAQKLQKVLAAGIVAVALFVMVRSWG